MLGKAGYEYYKYMNHSEAVFGIVDIKVIEQWVSGKGGLLFVPVC